MAETNPSSKVPELDENGNLIGWNTNTSAEKTQSVNADSVPGDPGFNRFYADNYLASAGGLVISGNDRHAGAVYGNGPHRGKSKGQLQKEAFDAWLALGDGERQQWSARATASSSLPIQGPKGAATAQQPSVPDVGGLTNPYRPTPPKGFTGLGNMPSPLSSISMPTPAAMRAHPGTGHQGQITNHAAVGPMPAGETVKSLVSPYGTGSVAYVDPSQPREPASFTSMETGQRGTLAQATDGRAALVAAMPALTPGSPMQQATPTVPAPAPQRAPAELGPIPSGVLTPPSVTPPPTPTGPGVPLAQMMKPQSAPAPAPAQAAAALPLTPGRPLTPPRPSTPQPDSRGLPLTPSFGPSRATAAANAVGGLVGNVAKATMFDPAKKALGVASTLASDANRVGATVAGKAAGVVQDVNNAVLGTVGRGVKWAFGPRPLPAADPQQRIHPALENPPIMSKTPRPAAPPSTAASSLPLTMPPRPFSQASRRPSYV